MCYLELKISLTANLKDNLKDNLKLNMCVKFFLKVNLIFKTGVSQEIKMKVTLLETNLNSSESYPRVPSR